ncbi:MAG TPA: acyl-CoA dehydrogenase family protein, partial [Caulobacterales bacterium]|nr:acyl-CoA dehydrogenase family protein [Caulobacterales bacterium]
RIASGMGFGMVGPTLLEFGTEAQKTKHLPPISRGEKIWCLGYSEPGAGSDLASLTTRAEDAGDHWIVNGQKIWTSGAHMADWCGALVRTDPDARKHDGISFMLIDMRQPGVVARPLKLIDGSAGFCEVFFTGARAEKENLLGALNNGWSIGKRLLQYERGGQTGAAGSAWADQSEPLQTLARRYVGLDASGRLIDPDLRARLTVHLMDAQAHALTLARAAAESRAGASNATSILKNSASHVGQTRSELALEIMGNRGLGWEGEGFAADEAAAVRRWLFGKAQSIVGGAFEVQNNIIAKRLLGLPSPIAMG